MAKYFYSHLISVESIIVELDQMELSEKERVHLAHLVDAHVHTGVLDAILSELSEPDKKIFLEHLKNDKHDKIWELLHSRVDSIESKIQKTAEEVKKELHEDISEAKRR